MRILVPLILIVVALVSLVGLRLRAQQEALQGPASGSGEIEATAVDLSSRVAARLTDVYVDEGLAVRKGDLLLRLDCSDPLALLEEAKARAAAARAQAEGAGASVAVTRSSRLAALASEEAARAQAAALQARREAAERQAQRLAAIAADVPAARVDETRSQAAGLLHQEEAARARATASAAQARAATVQISASSAQVGAAEAQVAAAEAGLSRAQLMVAECEVRAPIAGFVSSLPHEAGELVSPSNVLARLLSLDDLEATFYLPNAELAAVRPGAPARVEADAWPGEVFEATVKTVALQAEFTPRNIQTRSDRDRLVYPVTVAIADGRGKLRAGMPVQVTLPGTEPPHAGE